MGIVSPVGTDLAEVLSSIKNSFEEKGYYYHHVKVSHLIESIATSYPTVRLQTDTKLHRVNSLINLGNRIRRDLGNDMLAALAVTEINLQRFASSEGGAVFERRVFVVDQLKTEAELALLREVYGPGFFQVSVYSARDIRVDNLSLADAHDHLVSEKNRYRSKAEAVVTRDDDERDVAYGQKVGRIFQLADFVVNADELTQGSSPKEQVRRFVDLLFGANGYSPNRAEYGMYLANSAALRSLDLSRQVGAAVFRKSGEIAALGSNEVPRAGGGTYWAGEPFDTREYKLGKDSNDARKAELLREVQAILRPKKRIGAKKLSALHDTQFMDALEYGRIVHAEMSAISDAARLGVPIAGGTLYCTTFPCHMCAKHIVAAGIDSVIFLEPYPKSLASDLHSDSIKVEGTSRGIYENYPAVKFIPFHGITPRRYREFFSRGKRKSGLAFEAYPKGKPTPILSIAVPWYANREAQIMKTVETALRSLNSKA